MWSILIVVIVFLVAKVLFLQDLGEQEAVTFIKEGAVLVDVRTIAEYEGGHVDGALNIPVDELEHLAKNMLSNHGDIILLYCLSGSRAMIAKQLLKKAGYENVYNLGTLGRADSINKKAART